MKFTDYPYTRVDFDQIKADLTRITNNLGLKTAQDDIDLLNQYYRINDDISTNFNLAYIRNAIDTSDQFYEDEVSFINDVSPLISSVENLLIQKLLSSVHLDELKKHFGSHAFDMLSLKQKTFNDEIIADLQNENKLQTSYQKLISSAKITFEQKTYTLSQMTPFVQSKDRSIRKAASIQVSKWFHKNQKAFDQVYDDLVMVRHQMALKLGYENFIQLGYDRLLRTDYTEKDVKKYRKQIKMHVVGLTEKLNQKRKIRLGLDELFSYDLSIGFTSGNPTPKGNEEELVQKAQTMYQAMSKETNKFFKFMLDHQLLDLSSKPNKAPGGFCSYLPNYHSPFIFANFNQTSHDIDVLTHEAGHAFQVYTSQNLIPPYRFPTYEACEIHSMSMEFLAYPWMESFFKEDTDKYLFTHLNDAILFLPYGALVDEFQHHVYRKPDLTPRKRRSIWRKLEKEYLPSKKYDGDAFLENGGFFFRQMHIFLDPFYYIDYTLAQVVAFEFFELSNQDYANAWKKYLKLCKLGGSKSFLGLLKSARLSNPFKNGSIEKIIKPLEDKLNSIDDSKF